jgi:hypothetical protein
MLENNKTPQSLYPGAQATVTSLVTTEQMNWRKTRPGWDGKSRLVSHISMQNEEPKEPY